MESQVLQQAPGQGADLPPVWLVRITLVSLCLASLALTVLLWAKWGVVLTMAQDVIKFCF